MATSDKTSDKTEMILNNFTILPPEVSEDIINEKLESLENKYLGAMWGINFLSTLQFLLLLILRLSSKLNPQFFEFFGSNFSILALLPLLLLLGLRKIHIWLLNKELKQEQAKQNKYYQESA